MQIRCEQSLLNGLVANALEIQPGAVVDHVDHDLVALL